MTYWEFEWFIHERKEKIAALLQVDVEKVQMLKSAVKHYMYVRKLDHTRRGIYSKKIALNSITINKIGEYNEQVYKGRVICGSPTKGARYDDWRCIRKAGQGTKHEGYGFCMEHELIASSGERELVWRHLEAIHAAPTLQTLIVKAREVDKHVGRDIGADIAYMEIARQVIMLRIEAVGSNEALAKDLAYVTETCAKVKTMYEKVRQMNWIPPEQVNAIILQVLDTVTSGESGEVRARIAERAAGLTKIIIPRMDDKVVPVYDRSEEIKRALAKSKSYLKEDADWTALDSVTGKDLEEETVSVKEPPYKRNHSWIQHAHPKSKLKLKFNESGN